MRWNEPMPHASLNRWWSAVISDIVTTWWTAIFSKKLTKELSKNATFWLKLGKLNWCSILQTSIRRLLKSVKMVFPIFCISVNPCLLNLNLNAT